MTGRRKETRTGSVCLSWVLVLTNTSKHQSPALRTLPIPGQKSLSFSERWHCNNQSCVPWNLLLRVAETCPNWIPGPYLYIRQCATGLIHFSPWNFNLTGTLLVLYCLPLQFGHHAPDNMLASQHPRYPKQEAASQQGWITLHWLHTTVRILHRNERASIPISRRTHLLRLFCAFVDLYPWVYIHRMSRKHSAWHKG